MPKSKKQPQEEIVIDAFAAGKYPQGEFTEKELSEIATTYDPLKYEAPILIGHLSDPAYKGKTTIPAFGWIGKVKKVKNHLKLIVSQFSDELKEYIQKGYYKKVSSAFFSPDDPSNPTPGKWHLHHLAFLGAVPPQVKGLEGIAFGEYSLKVAGIEFSETDLVIDFDAIEEVEEIGTEDTLKDITEAYATCYSKIEETLKGDADTETQRKRIDLAIYDLNNELLGIVQQHFNFMNKVDELKPSEMAEQKTGKFKKLIIELAQSLTNKKEPESMTDQEKQEMQTLKDENAAQKVKLQEFAQKEQQAKDEKLQAEKQAKQNANVKSVKEFCDKATSENKMTPATRAQVEPVMVEMANADLKVKSKDKDGKDIEVSALTMFQAQFDKPIVPLGVTDLGNAENDTRPLIIQQADKYVKAHTSEFSGMTATDAINRAVYLQSTGKINFEAIK